MTGDLIRYINCSILVERSLFAISDLLLVCKIYHFVLSMACGGMILTQFFWSCVFSLSHFQRKLNLRTRLMNFPSASKTIFYKILSGHSKRSLQPSHNDDTETNMMLRIQNDRLQFDNTDFRSDLFFNKHPF